MIIQQCDVQVKCHALLVEAGLLKPESVARYICGWRGAGTIKDCPKRGRFMEEKGENDER